MLSPKIVELLNDQVSAELYASQVYLQMGAWCDAKGLPGAAAFFMGHVSEEIGHRDQIVQYLFDCDCAVQVGALDAPEQNFDNLLQVIETAYAHEQKVTAMINTIASEAITTSDFNTFNFIQTFIAEQREEEALFRGILEQATLVSFDGSSGEAMRHMNSYLQRISEN